MPHLKECSRSAAIAFSPLGPHLAAGTVAGVIDMSFSTSSVLEVFSTDFSSGGKKLELAGGPTSAPERFQRLAWGRLGSDGATKAGVLAGGLADGTVLLWDAAKVIGSPAAAEGAGTHVTKLTKHTGPVRGLQFNSLNSPHLLASGGADAEINIWNLADLRRPTSYPASKAGANGQTAAAEVSAVAWNHLADHILASGAGGAVTVWDLKQQRPRSVLRDDNRNPRRISALAWHPVVATKIVVAYEDDHCPVLQLWDLRQSVSHVCEYQGHAKGILGLSWCLQDPGMLVSTGKDSRTLLWDADRGQQLGEFATPSFNFDVAWSPTQPGVFATSSYGGGGGDDGTVTLHNLASFTAGDPHASNGHLVPAPLARAPAWLRRPVGASFGFGGRLATLSNEGGRPTVSVRQVTTERELVERSQRFEAAIRGGDRSALAGFCEAQAAAAAPDAAETWRFLRVHFEEDPRSRLMAELGFEGLLPQPEPAAEEGVDAAAEQLDSLALEQQQQPSQQPAEPPPEFDGDGTDFFDNDDGKDAFEPPPAAAAAPPAAAPVSQPASPAAGAKEEPGKNEDAIQRALFVGNYAAALNACFEAGRMADALVIGHMGQGPHLARAQREYMRRQPRPYMRMVRAVLEGDLLSLVKSRPLGAWRETLALLTSYSQGEEWAGLCDALARRLAAAGQAHAATLAWVCAGSVDAAVRAWSQALQRGGVTVAGLQGLMERAVVLGLGVQQQTATPALAELLSQYAGILASQGCMGMALEYLDMIPGEPAGPTGVLKDRIYYSGAPDIPADAQPPPYPFADAPAPVAPAPAAPAAAAHPPAAPSAAGDYFSANAYRTSGTYGGGGSYGAAAGAFSQPPQQQQPAAYADYGQSSGYDAYGQQGQAASGGYGQAGYSFGAASQPPSAPPVAAPPTQSAYAQPKPASPSYSQPAYGGYDQQQQQQPAYSAYSAPAPPQRPPQQQTPAASHGWQQPAASAGPSSWGQPVQPPSPAAAPAPPPQPPALFVPSRSSAAPSQPPQQVQAPPLFVPTSLGAAKPAAAGPPGGPPPSFAQPQQPPTPPAPSKPAPPPAPAGPPANISITSADTSKVPADAQPIVRTLRAVYERCAPVAAAAPGKRREMEDTARRLGQLFWRLNAGEASPRVVASLRELCAALDARDFATAAQKQVQLTSSDWDECSSFLTGLKRLIKAAQMLG